MEDQRAAALKARLVYVKIVTVKGSELPYRVERRRNGTMDGGPFLTMEQAEACVLKLDLEKLSQKSSKKRTASTLPKSNSYKVPRYSDYR